LDFASVLPTSLFRSSTLRYALLCIGLFSAWVFVLFGYVYWSTVSFVRARSDHEIGVEYAALRQAYDRGGSVAVAEALAPRGAARRFDQGIYLLADASFAPIAGNLNAWPRLADDGDGFGDGAAPTGNGRGEPRRIRARFDTLPNGDHLLAGRDINDLDQFAGKIRIAFAATIVMMFALAAAASVSVARRTVGRIEAINTASREIMRSGLSNRIPIRGTRDEWDHLAENLNSMLDRIEELMEGIKQVSDNIAHDLRTPLSRVRGRLERASKKRLDADESRFVICDTIGEIDRILVLFSSILRIARLEAHEGAATFQIVDLAEIVGQIAELFDAAAEEKGGHVTLVGTLFLPVTGDRDLLFDAVANLVDNAIKYGGADGLVTIEIKRGADGPILAVSDRGPGIPPGERKNVLKRIYRLERSRTTPGNGLGLSLVAAVADLHGVQIAMSCNEPGLRIELRFPPPKIAPPAAPPQQARASKQDERQLS
jgi:signal transduction histidine kinase